MTWDDYLTLWVAAAVLCAAETIDPVWDSTRWWALWDWAGNL